IVSAGYTVPVEEKLTYTSTNTEIAVTLKNVGIEASDNLNVTLSSNDPQLTIDKNTATCGSIAPDGSAIVKFNVTVANNIPDNKIFMTEITATETGKGSWSNSLPLMAYAPVFSLEKVLVNGVENGNLEAGTVVELTAVVKNKGGADAYKVKGNLDIKSPYITFACEEQVAIEKNLPAGETIEITFHVTTSPEMPYGHQAAIDLLLTAQYGRSHTAPFTISNTGSNNYCTPGTTNCSQYNDRITSLQLIKVSDQSVLINHAPTCSSGGYTNYTGMVANFVPGAQYTIKVKTGYQNHRVRGWIDLNGNKTFDSNEALFTITCTSANVEYSATFTIPEDFTPGTQRFRIRTQDGGTVPGPCNAYTYGQTLDYSAFLPELYPCVQNVVAVLGENKVTVTWNAPASGTPIGYNVYRGGNKLNTALLTTTTFTEQNITEGVYAYNVTAVYSGNKESPALMSNVVCNFTACIAPVELSVELEGNTAVLTWEDASEMAGILSGYNVFRNKTKINAALVTEKKYLDENLPSGTHNYQVTAVYEHCESEMTDAETITILPCETPTNVEAVVDNNTVIITWNEPEDLEGVELLGYNIYRNEEQINETLITELEYRDEELPAGTYLYQVTAVYEHCPESEMTDAVSVTILPPLPCETPLEPEGEAEGNTAIIIWGVKELIEGMELVKHHVYRDGIRLDGIPFMGDFGWEYHDEGLENGEYLYQTAAVYEHCEESEWTEGVVVVINVLTIADIPTNSYKIFPNPTHDKVNIVGNIAPNSVRIYNITGQLTYETTTCAANMTITIETMPTGIYFIKIDSDYGSTTQKLILK
ncbi:MAG: GEVED domain-containing protein, partial [Bacteroidales bacterium]|nr:GEVED domain-containing protein [Bacteroidales bacterium]